MTGEPLKEYQNEMAKKRRIQQQAIAILKRAKAANIPQADMRITENQFFSLLDLSYFKMKNILEKDVKALCFDLFNNPKKILKIPFILIDGGDYYSRRRAGFALLFRMIAWDNSGLHIDCGELTHAVQSVITKGDISRNEFADNIKDYDILFISECIRTLFRAKWEEGSFFDEILADRETNSKPTIVTMTNNIPFKHVESPDKSSEISTGRFMQMFTDSDSGDRDYKNILRIRIK